MIVTISLLYSSVYLDIVGYISCLTPTKISTKNNPFFDATVQVEDTSSKQVRVMVNNATKRNIFLEKLEAKSPVKLSNLSSPTNGRTIFYNSNTGSRLANCEVIDFKYKEQLTSNVEDILKNQPTGAFNIVGSIKWLEEGRVVLCGPNKTQRCVRTGVIADSTGCVKISIWGDLINEVTEDNTVEVTSVKLENFYGPRLSSSTSSTITNTVEQITINWEKHDISPMTSILSCPEIESVKIHSYLQCVNIDCRKKVSPFPGDRAVVCQAAACKRKMLVKRCKQSFTVEILVSNHEDTASQYLLTVFPQVLRTVIRTEGKTDDEIEDEILNLENIDFTFNKKKVVLSMTQH